MKDFDQQFGARPDQGEAAEQPYQPIGNTPVGYLSRGIRTEDILLGNGFLERASAVLLAGPSGIGKSSLHGGIRRVAVDLPQLESLDFACGRLRKLGEELHPARVFVG